MWGMRGSPVPANQRLQWAGNNGHLFAKPGLRKVTRKPRMPDHQVRETADYRGRFYYGELAHCLNTLSKSSRDCDDQVCIENRQRCGNEDGKDRSSLPLSPSS